jgi:murein L,D-transpeptidase YcbB/YkuD
MVPVNHKRANRKQEDETMYHNAFKRFITTILIIFCAFCSASSAQEASTSQVIQSRMDLLGSKGSLKIEGADIRAILVLPMFYEKREFEPVWTDPGKFEELRKMIAALADDGLVPEDYHLAAIDVITGSQDHTYSPDSKANLDILCTDALLSLGYHMKFGKVDPERLDANWNIYGDLTELSKIIEQMKEVFEGGSGAVTRAIDEIRPPYELYRALSRALVKYRTMEAEGGWPTIPDGEVLKEGMRDQRVIKLRERLAVTGDLKIERPVNDLFNEEVEKGVESFQKRHGLNVDGIVGKMTITTLNIPISEKIDRIRINLERLRWVMQDDSHSFIIVNIAGFEVFYLRNEELAWRSRVQVGKEYRKTPVFRAKMDYIVFNPTWTVPPTILEKDMIPKAAKNPAYLDGKNIKVIDNKGRVIPSAEVNWKKYLDGGFPYILRQDPGPNNALGRVKFIFPNKHFVFLHDTSSRSLFSRSKRTFSSGCIRVENPLEFAEVLLNDPGNWNIEKIEQLIESAKTKTVHLDKPLPVFLLYWTAFVNYDGTVHFREDIYERDKPILKDLDSGFRARDRHMKKRGL